MRIIICWCSFGVSPAERHDVAIPEQFFKFFLKRLQHGTINFGTNPHHPTLGASCHVRARLPRDENEIVLDLLFFKKSPHLITRRTAQYSGGDRRYIKPMQRAGYVEPFTAGAHDFPTAVIDHTVKSGI